MLSKKLFPSWGAKHPAALGIFYPKDYLGEDADFKETDEPPKRVIAQGDLVLHDWPQSWNTIGIQVIPYGWCDCR